MGLSYPTLTELSHSAHFASQFGVGERRMLQSVNRSETEVERSKFTSCVTGTARCGCNVRRHDVRVANLLHVLRVSCRHQDTRFNREVDEKTGYKTRSILCMPIHDGHGDVIGVAQAINKLSIVSEPFSEKDEKVRILQ